MKATMIFTSNDIIINTGIIAAASFVFAMLGLGGGMIYIEPERDKRPQRTKLQTLIYLRKFFIH
jgi:hypothetical protein